jgi:hypothetical protein
MDTSYIIGVDPGFYARGGALLGEWSENPLRSPAGPEQRPLGLSPLEVNENEKI